MRRRETRGLLIYTKAGRGNEKREKWRRGRDELVRQTCGDTARHMTASEKKKEKLYEGDLLCSLGDLSHLYWLDMLLC